MNEVLSKSTILASQRNKGLIDPVHVTSFDRTPILAIVIPVYKHSVLVVEAIACALKEAHSANGVVVIVNDGCPYEETHLACLSFANAYTERVEYIRTPNGGLSTARNRGIKHALGLFPSVECVYLLDADNRLSSGSMSRVKRFMQQSGADWVYPNIDKFGIEWSGDFTAPYSILRHLFQNVCEAGSMIHRRVFDSGVFFDEDMRQGYEDWEFWLQCVDAGFRGAPYGDFGFQYRARRESMVRNSSRADAEIMAYMHRKHKRLFSWANILRLEHHEAPRYCIVDSAYKKFSMTSIPSSLGDGHPTFSIPGSFWSNVQNPTHSHFPHFIIWADQRLLSDMSANSIIDWAFWQIEDLLESNNFVFVYLDRDAQNIRVSTSSYKSLRTDEKPSLVATTRACLLACVEDPNTGWIDSIATNSPEPSIGILEIKAPLDQRTLRTFGVDDALSEVFRTFTQLREAPSREEARQQWEWRHIDALITGYDVFSRIRSHMGAFAPMACCATGSEREIAFIAPIVSFGGVEQVAIQVAREFKKVGWKTRLIITETDGIASPDRLRDAFDVFCFLNDPVHSKWNPAGEKYYGHDMQKWGAEGRIDRLIGLVAGCHAVINFHARQSNEAMGWLRRQGVMTLTSLHVIDKDVYGAPQGHPYLMLAYEHAYDLVLAPSRQLINFCNALGTPEAKLLLLPNAASFDIPRRVIERRAKRLREEARDQLQRPLRVLSLGRLDRQKGIERLAATIRMAEARGLSIEWRFVGSRVVAGDSSLLTDDDMSKIDLQPAVYSRTAVIEHLSWADVSILLSHWEGSPLSIVEAQGLGVIPLVTAVGAVSEMIENGVDGLVVPSGSVEQTALAAVESLRRLENLSYRHTLASNAIARVTQTNWKNSCHELIERVDIHTKQLSVSRP